ncbi:MAG: hypothetical protein ACYCPO_15965 [Acidobacteriaceae bacterium]
MASEEKIRERIREIAGRKNNVDAAEIDWVMNQLKQFGNVSVETENVHIKMWRFDDEIFSICPHTKGGRQLKPVYVKNFLNAMMKTGWYD